MVAPLLKPSVLRQLQILADRSKRSTARIGRRTATANTRGGSSLGAPVWDGPYPCRLDPSGQTVADEMRGEGVVSVGPASVALPLSINLPNTNDRVEVTTIHPNGVTTSIEVFDVVGDPFITSYAIEVTVPVRKVGD